MRSASTSPREQASVWSGTSSLPPPRSPVLSHVTETGVASLPATPATPWGGTKATSPQEASGSSMVPNPVFSRGKITPLQASQAGGESQGSVEARVTVLEAAWETWQREEVVARAAAADEASRIAKATGTE